MTTRAARKRTVRVTMRGLYGEWVDACGWVRAAALPDTERWAIDGKPATRAELDQVEADERAGKVVVHLDLRRYPIPLPGNPPWINL